MNFVFDALQSGAGLKLLTVGDYFTQECLSIEVGTSFVCSRVMKVLDRLVQQHGAPEYLKSDNGSEFIAYALQAWLGAR